MEKTYPLYRCEVTDNFTKEEPDCSNCHTRSCQYNTGNAPNPCIMVKDVVEDESGKIIFETEQRPLYP